MSPDTLFGCAVIIGAGAICWLLIAGLMFLLGLTQLAASLFALGVVIGALLTAWLSTGRESQP